MSGMKEIQMRDMGKVEQQPVIKDDDLQTKEGTSKIKAEQSRDKLKSKVLSIISGLTFSANGAIVKKLTELHPSQIALFQYIGMVLISLPLAIKSGQKLFGPDKWARLWFFICGLCDAGTIFCAFMSFKLLTLGQATAVTSIVPAVVFVASMIFLKEKFGKLQIFGVILSIVGVCFVSRVPDLLFEESSKRTGISFIGIGYSLLAVVLESAVYIFMRKLKHVNEHVKLLNIGLVATAATLIGLASFGEFSIPKFDNLLLILLCVLFNYVSQLTLAKGLETEEAGGVSVLMATGDIVLAFVLDLVMFRNMPGTMTIIGAVLVLVSAGLV